MRTDRILMRDGRLPVLFAVLALLSWSVACQKAEITNSNANTATANTSAPSSSTTPSTASATPTNVNADTPTSPGSVSLATPTDAYKAGYNARKNKDITALKRVLSKDALDFFKEMAEIDKKTLDDALKTLADKPQAATAETKNEKIDGSRATLEYLDEKGKWGVMDFIKEGSDWKIDIPKGP